MSRFEDFETTAKEIKALRVIEGEHKAQLRARLLTQHGAKENPMSAKMRLVLAASMACLALLAYTFLVEFSAPKALAATIEALKDVTSMVCRAAIQTDRNGEPEVVTMTIYWAGDATRVDFGGEGQPAHQTMWIEPDKTTTVDFAEPGEPTATIVLNAEDYLSSSARITSADALIEVLKRSGAVEVVDERVQKGQKLSVLHLEQWDGFRQDVELLADSATGLPVSVTQTFEGGVARQDFEWNVEIAADLMAVRLPEGVTPTVIDASEQAPPLPVVPGAGIGPVRLGMTSEEVRQALGRPDKVRMAEDGLPRIMWYTESFGVTVLFGTNDDERNRVVSVSGSLGQYVARRYRDFTGTTPEGIGLGATAEEIIAAYGDTDNHTLSHKGEEIIVYEQPSLDFRLRADPRYGWGDEIRRVHTIFVTKYPTPKTASFRGAPVRQTAAERETSAAIRAQCANNMKQLAAGCVTYAQEHNDRFPDRLSELYPDYVNDLRLFSCPGSRSAVTSPDRLDEQSSYGIKPGLTISSPQESVLLYEKANHSPGPAGRHECLVDGQVVFTSN
ncbi:MAG: hypothetical protein JXR94_24945 [Candidatus Hydrogenedentes bacterium]|nr:hypothetical protein [Candidatus Hydrogenedentota bacterium]